MKVMVIAAATYADPHTRKLFDHVAAGGVEVLLAMPRRIVHPFAPNDVPETPWPTPGVRLERLDTWISHENGTHILMKGIPRLIREFRPDVIHCVMEPWALTCFQVLATIAEMEPRPKFGVQPCETKPEQGGFFARAARQRLYRYAIGRCDFFVGWSTLAVRAARRLGLDGQMTAVAPAVAVDMEAFRPPARSEHVLRRRMLGIHDHDSLAVGYVGRFVPEKGLSDLLEAADKLASTRQPPIVLALMGSGPMEDTLRQAALTRPWMGIHAPQPLSGVVDFLHGLDCLVLPSRPTQYWEEQFGLVLSEALASGIHVVGSTSGSIPEVLSGHGLVFQAGSADHLARCLLSVGSNRDREPEQLEAVRRYVADRYSPQSVAHTLVEQWRATLPTDISGRSSNSDLSVPDHD